MIYLMHDIIPLPTPHDLSEIARCLRLLSSDWKTSVDIFYDLMFVLSVPQTKYERAVPVMKELQRLKFHEDMSLGFEDLVKVAKPLRFYNNKTKWLLVARQTYQEILTHLVGNAPAQSERRWLVSNVKGLGWKTSSHLLRNLGARDLAIIDTHVLKFLNTRAPKNATEYLGLEDEFRQISQTEYNMTVAELDIYIWKMYADVPWDLVVF